MASSVTSDNENITSIPYWAKEVQQPMVWSPHDNKFLVLDQGYKEERDWDYYPPLSEDEESEEETEEIEDIELLKKEAEEPLDKAILEGKHRTSREVLKPPKIVVTPPKKEREDIDGTGDGGVIPANETGSGDNEDGEPVTVEETSGEDKSEVCFEN